MATQPITTVNQARCVPRQSRPWRLVAPRRPVRTAALVDRIAPTAPRCELVSDPDLLEALAGPWSELAKNAVDANVLFEPAALLAAIRHLGSNLRMLLVWQGEKLIGAFPLQTARLHGLPLPGATLLSHEYSFLSLPLLHRDHVHAAAAAYAQFIAQGGAGAFMLHGQIHVHGATAEALKRAFDLHGMTYRAYDVHERACLRSDLQGDAYLQQALSKKRQKEYRRLAARLGEQGRLAFDLVEAPLDVAEGLQQFLRLEAAGWKGDRGTAMAAQASSKKFAETFAASAVVDGTFRVARLMLDGRPVAAALMLSTGRTAYLWKIAYDETLAAFSPGVLLVLELTRRILDDRLFDMVDSCAIASHPMIDRIWRERIAIENLLVVKDHAFAPSAFAAYGGWQALRRLAKRSLQHVSPLLSRM